jgi:FkbM family methyltransferase
MRLKQWKSRTHNFRDIDGANVGQHSLFASIYSKEVIAFEPYPAVARKIQEKIDANNIRNIILCLVGLGEKDVMLPYKEPDSCNMGTGSFLVPDDPIPASSPTTALRVVNGDSYLSSIGAPKVDFIKMDVEGFEVHALRGLRQTLRESRPVIIMEWSSVTHKTLGEGSLPDLYPEDYVFYQFEPHVPVFDFFRKLNNELVPLQENPSEGNILAMPIDFVERFATRRPALKLGT